MQVKKTVNLKRKDEILFHRPQGFQKPWKSMQNHVCMHIFDVDWATREAQGSLALREGGGENLK